MTPDAEPSPSFDPESRIRDLERRLFEAEETLQALRNGEVDAIVAAGPDGDRVYTLRGADEAYRIMVQEMSEGALTVTAGGLILFSNRQFATLLGVPLEKVMGARMRDFVVPEDAGVVAEILAGTDGKKAEVKLRPVGAAHMPVYLSAQRVVVNETECQCIIVTDLSAQKRHEEIAAVLEAVPVGVFIARDVDCRTIAGNRVAHELLHVRAGGDVSGPALDLGELKGWRVVRDGREIPEEELPLQIAARTGRRVSDCELEILFDDGASRCWLGQAVPLFNEAGRPRGAVGAFNDITERKRTAEALDAANTELRNFANALTQDLREPLTAVVKVVRLLAREKPGAYLDNALNSVSRMEGLLNALLQYWEIAQRTTLTLEPVDCNKLLAKVLADLQPAIRESGAKVTSGGLPLLVAEQDLFGLVFQTLVGNSIQYRGAAVPAIHISAEQTYDRWLFSLRDNGIGIERKNAEKIFEMFSRPQGDEIPGTGIGLALCKKIVERLGGRIWVESEPGKGAAFRFTIPAHLGTIVPAL